jgi:hypothetical protein
MNYLLSLFCAWKNNQNNDVIFLLTVIHPSHVSLSFSYSPSGRNKIIMWHHGSSISSHVFSFFFGGGDDGAGRWASAVLVVALHTHR